MARRARDFAAEYARRRELASERGFSGRDITQAARGRATASGITSGLLRRLERDPGERAPAVIAYTDKDGNGRVVIVTHDKRGRAHVQDVRLADPSKVQALVDDLEDRMDDLGLEEGS